MTRGKSIILGIAGTLIIAAVALALFIRDTVRDAYASEWVAGHVIQYMESHDRSWPTGWEDLRPIHDQHVSNGNCPWSFEMLQDRVVVDWNANPQKLTDMPENDDAPPFNVISLKNGKTTYWSGMEPNGIIHDWLRDNQASK